MQPYTVHSVKAVNLVATMLMPQDSTADSLSLQARKARPQREFISLSDNAINIITITIYR